MSADRLRFNPSDNIKAMLWRLLAAAALFGFAYALFEPSPARRSVGVPDTLVSFDPAIFAQHRDDSTHR